MITMPFLNIKNQPEKIRNGIWSSIRSLVSLIGIQFFWTTRPTDGKGSFSAVLDSNTTLRFSKITAIYKAVDDTLSSMFVLLAIGFGQFRLSGYFHRVTLLMAILVDRVGKGKFVPNASTTEIFSLSPCHSHHKSYLSFFEIRL